MDSVPGRCWTCGYDLRATESGVCPECGRPFDPADPATTNGGRPPGRVGRFAVSGLSWGWVAWCAAAAGLAWGTVRPPVRGWHFSLADLRYYGDVAGWRGGAVPLSGLEAAYVGGVGLAGAALAWLVLRVLMRTVGLARYRTPREERGRFLGRGVLGGALLASVVGAIGVGWPYRLGQRWVAEARRPKPAGTVWMGPSFRGLVAFGLGDGADLVVLRSAVLQSGTAADQLLALGIISEGVTEPSEYAGVLREVIERGTDPATRAAAGRLLGLCPWAGFSPDWSADPRPAVVAILRQLAEHPDPAIRAAGLDGLSVLYDATLRGARPECLDTTPPIRLPLFMPSFGLRASPPTSLPPSDLRAFMLERMTGAATAAEREAAARGVVTGPQDAQIRYAEWGVFLTDAEGRPHLVKEQIDEIPAFVHRLGNPAAEFAGRLTGTGSVFKPVIHLTADRPCAVDLEVCIAGGKPWFAYPRFDDVVLLRGHPRFPKRLAELEPASFPALPDLREGYPFLSPHHREYPWLQFGGSSNHPQPVAVDYVGGMGVRWQSLIVSPARLPWMAPPAVPADPRFAWWGRLREVECSWVSSRGESERFLYYDGPTLAMAEGRFRIAADRLTWTINGADWPVADRRADMSAPADLPQRAFYFDIPAGAGAPARVVQMDDFELPFKVALPGGLSPCASPEATVKAELLRRGLTQGEAAGLLDCWRAPLFGRPGRRVLQLISRAEYDRLFPMEMRPAPARRVRVGILWTEGDQRQE